MNRRAVADIARWLLTALSRPSDLRGMTHPPARCPSVPRSAKRLALRPPLSFPRSKTYQNKLVSLSLLESAVHAFSTAMPPLSVQIRSIHPFLRHLVTIPYCTYKLPSAWDPIQSLEPSARALFFSGVSAPVGLADSPSGQNRSLGWTDGTTEYSVPAGRGKGCSGMCSRLPERCCKRPGRTSISGRGDCGVECREVLYTYLTPSLKPDDLQMGTILDGIQTSCHSPCPLGSFYR